MSIRQLNTFFDENIDIEAIMETLNKAYKGKAEITLSNYDNDLEPVVKIGSVFDNNGAIFLIESDDEAPADYGSISNNTVFYIVFDSNTDSFFYTEDAPVWSDSKQGWYNLNNRYFFSLYKDNGGALYQDKTLLLPQQNIKTKNVYSNGIMLKDNDIGLVLSSGSVDLNAPTTEKVFSDTFFGKTRELYCPGDGVVTTRYGLQTSAAGQQVRSVIYINGIERGTIRTSNAVSYIYYTEDFNVRKGDLIQIYGIRDGINGGRTIDFTIRTDIYGYFMEILMYDNLQIL
jgi:hypothetical protein